MIKWKVEFFSTLIANILLNTNRKTCVALFPKKSQVKSYKTLHINPFQKTGYFFYPQTTILAIIGTQLLHENERNCPLCSKQNKKTIFEH